MRVTPLMLLAAPVAVALTLALGGCGEGEETERMEERAETAPDAAETAVAEPSRLERAQTEAAAAAAKLREAGEQAGAAAADAAGGAMEAVQAKASEAAASLKQAGEQASAAATAAAQAASEKTAELTQSTQARAEEMIGEVQDYLRENDLNSAQGILDKLKGLRDQLSEGMQTEIDELQQRLSDEANNQTAG